MSEQWSKKITIEEAKSLGLDHIQSDVEWMQSQWLECFFGDMPPVIVPRVLSRRDRIIDRFWGILGYQNMMRWHDLNWWLHDKWWSFIEWRQERKERGA